MNLDFIRRKDQIYYQLNLYASKFLKEDDFYYILLILFIMINKEID